MCRWSRVAPDGLAWSLRHRRRIMEQPTRFVGMDVHKETIVVAVTATGEVGKATAYGTFPNTGTGLEKLVKRLRQAGGGAIKFCYEAGPCGYGVHRTLTRLGEECVVVAPSMMPRKRGDRQKNDNHERLYPPWPQGLDQGASALAGGAALCPVGAADRAGGGYRGG